MRWPLGHIDIEDCDVEQVGLLFSALGAARPGVRQHAALLLTGIAISRRDIWIEYLRKAFDVTVDGHRMTELFSTVSQFFPSTPPPIGTLAGASFVGELPSRDQVDWAISQGAVHPIALSSQILYVVETNAVCGNISNGYARLSDSLSILLVDGELPDQVQLWVLTGFLLQLLADIVEENFQSAEHLRSKDESLTTAENIAWHIKAKHLLGHAEPCRYTAEELVHSHGCDIAVAEQTIQILLQQRLLGPTECAGSYEVICEANQDEELLRIASLRVHEERAVFTELASISNMHGAELPPIVLRKIIAEAREQFTSIVLKADTSDLRSDRSAHAILAHGEEFHDTASRLANLSEECRSNIAFLRYQMMLALPMADFERRPACVLHEHACIVEAIESGNQELIDWCMQYHLIVPSMRWHPDKYAVLQRVCKATARLH